MSDWFKNPASEIPDEMWRAPTPMQRQADAVVLWAELTGKHASSKEAASKPLWKQQGVKGWAQEDALMAAIKAETNPAKKVKLTQRLRKLESSNLEREYGIKSASAPKPTLGDRLRGAKMSLTSTPIRKAPPEAMYMAAVGRKRSPTAKYMSYKGTNYKIASKAAREKTAAWKPGVAKAIRMGGDNLELTGAALGAPIGGLKAYTDYREGKGGISKAEASLKGEIAKAQSQKADKKKIAKLRQKLQTAKSRRENIGATTAKGVGLGAATGALGTHALKRMRKAGPK